MGYVEIHGLHRHFGDVVAVDGVDLSVAEGEFLVLLGPSGCGKTTLMRMVAGLERPTRGEIIIGGEPVDQDVPPRARGIAMVFQSYALYPHKTAFENIAFPLEAARFTRAAVKERVERTAGMFGIQTKLRRFPRELSGGERQRVALARAVVREPRVFLFDEPLANLDAQQRTIARFELKQLQRRLKATIIYVTHDQVEAMGLGDRIVVMNQGRILQIGAPVEVYDNPADTFVATFLGSPPMTLISRSDGILLGFRPERLLPRELLNPQEQVAPFRLRVAHVEYLGANRLVYGALDGSESGGRAVIAALPATVTFPIAIDEVYDFAVEQRAVRYFDARTTKALSHGTP